MQGCGGGKSDPIMTGFSGRSFNFFGEVNKTYNLISSAHHQLSMKLKLAQMWNHNGTNMMVSSCLSICPLLMPAICFLRIARDTTVRGITVIWRVCPGE